MITEKPENGREVEVMRLMADLSRLFRTEIRRACGENGVPMGYRSLLFHLARENGQSQKELADRTGLKAATVSITIEKMERDGYVRKERDELDKRAVRVFLTEKGVEIDRRNKEKIDELEKLFSSFIDEEEQMQLKSLLQKMIDGYLALAGENAQCCGRTDEREKFER